jgi:cardiolipin synthase
MNIPNSLTLLRIFLIPLYVGLMVYERFPDAIAVLFMAGLTDALDGTIARWTNQRTSLGAILDPFADKLLLVTCFVTLSVLHMIPSWVAILVVSRDLMLVLGTLVAKLNDSPVDLSPTLLGKLTTFTQLTYVFAIMLGVVGMLDRTLVHPLVYLVTVLTGLSGFHYLYRGYLQASLGSPS